MRLRLCCRFELEDDITLMSFSSWPKYGGPSSIDAFSALIGPFVDAAPPSWK